MPAARPVPDDHPAFADLGVRRLTVGLGSERMAVHVDGRLTGALPLVCLAGYQRNMADFADFAALYRRHLGADWPIILIDLKGRGRSTDRANKAHYVTTMDAGDVAQVLAALCVDAAVFLGQGHGGHVIMALAAHRPTLIAGSALIDAGPAGNPHGLVRLRNNLRALDGNRSEAGFRTMLRRVLTAEYPEVPDEALDRLAMRTHFLDSRGRVRALFDDHLIQLLEPFEHDDVLLPQWPHFDALGTAPLMMMRTSLTDQLREEMFDEMMRRRPDASAYVIEAQGSPALLNREEDMTPIAVFVQEVARSMGRAGKAVAKA